MTATLGLVSAPGNEAVPVDTKRGRVPRPPERSWEPERVQQMAQGYGILIDVDYSDFHTS